MAELPSYPDTSDDSEVRSGHEYPGMPRWVKVSGIIVIVLILMHSGKDAGLSGAFGVGTGAGPLGGGSLVERNLTRWTIFFSCIFVLNVIVLLKI